MKTRSGPAPAPPRRIALASLAELAGLALATLVIWRIFVPFSPPFIILGTAVGAVGLLAAGLLRRSARTSIDGPLLTYVGLTLLSAVVNHARFVPTLVSQEPAVSWQPALQVAALTVYFYGASWLFATERRLGALVTAIVVTISVFGVQASYFHLLAGFAFRPLDYPLLTRWTGYTPLGLLFALAFSFSLPLTMVAASPLVFLAAALVTLTLLLDVIAVYSRTATLSAVVTYATLSGVELFKLKGWRLCAVGLVSVAIAGGALSRRFSTRAVFEFFQGNFYSYRRLGDGMRPVEAFTSRLTIWNRVIPEVKDHPLLGVGPGNYGDAMRQRYESISATEPQYPSYSVHAHNILLQVAVESGVPAMIAFSLIWWKLLRGLLQQCSHSRRGVLAMGLFGALLTFFLKSMLEHLLSGLTVSTRVSFLLWTLFAAAVALGRLAPSGVAARSTGSDR